MTAASKDTLLSATDQIALEVDVTDAMKLATYAFDGLDAGDDVLDDLCDAVLAMDTVQKPPFAREVANVGNGSHG